MRLGINSIKEALRLGLIPLLTSLLSLAWLSHLVVAGSVT